MTLQDQWKIIKNNWLVIVIVLLAMVFFSVGDELLSSVSYSGGYAEDYGESVGMVAESIGYAPSRMIKSGFYPPIGTDDFAPEVEDRKITKTASVSTKVAQGNFSQAEQQLKGILYNELFRLYAMPILLNENVQKYGESRRQYYSGSYTLKVDVRVYDAVISQLKQIGEVQSFSENAQDITGTYTNIQTELEAERARLERYRQMLDEATEVADKIELSDRIFNQERTIKYLEDSLQNQDEQVEYATIYIQITEKQSEFASVVFVTFGQLITGLVSSISNLLKLAFTLLPWAIVIVAVWLGVRWMRRRK